MMKNLKILINTAFLLFSYCIVVAQTQTPTTQVLPDTSKMTYNQISQTGDLVVFPSNNQSKEQQKIDEFDCYLWAMETTGLDPLNLPKVEVEQVDKGPEGHAVAGAARGAAAGAAIGAITGDAGTGAAIGATAGAIRGRRAKRYGDQMEQQQNVANAAEQEKAMRDKFKKAFSACMEGKGYTVK